jgi:predicted transglutaminase-like protease
VIENKKNTISVTKGVAHATLIPLLIMIFTNYVFSGNFGIVSATAYIIVSTTIYRKHKDVIAKMAFYYTILAFLTLLLILASIVMAISI